MLHSSCSQLEDGPLKAPDSLLLYSRVLTENLKFGLRQITLIVVPLYIKWNQWDFLSQEE